MIEISIVIPTYNAEPYLVRCLTSCLKQNLSPSQYEIVIINDGSKDGSLAIAEEMAQKHPNIHVYSQKNQGLSMARNNGLKKTTGEYVWFVDADDWIEENCLSDILKTCKDNKLDMYSFCAADVKEGKQKRRFNYKFENSLITGMEVINYAFFPPCAPFSIYRKDFLVDNGLSFYPGIFHEDSEFQPRAYFMAKRVMMTDEVFYYVYHSPNSIGRSYNPKKAFDQLVVMERLHSFMHANNVNLKGFHYRIGLVLNNSLSEACVLDHETQIKFNHALNEHKEYLVHLKKSGLKKYKLEYVLFRMIPGRYIQIYKLLRKLK